MQARMCALFFVLFLSNVALVAGMRDDLVIQPNFRGLTYYGTFETVVPVAVGEVVDRRSVSDRRFLGKGPNGVYELYTQDSPEIYLRAALLESLKSLGLAPREGDRPEITVRAEVWRAHAWVRMGARARLRCEINVRFMLMNRAGQPAGSVSVIGNSEIKGQVVTKERWKALFDQALYDTMEKFASSRTFAKVLPAEVTASFKKSVTPAPQARYKAAEIETEKFYGPRSSWPNCRRST